MGLMRLEILDAKGGVCLYEKVWKWSGVSRPEGLCKLVLTFYQISKEIGDTGEVSQVLFEPPDKVVSGSKLVNNASGFGSQGKGVGGTAKGGSGAQRGANRYIGSLKGGRQSNRNQQPNIRLASSRNATTIAAIFHEVGDDLNVVKNLSKAILNDFENMFGQKMKDSRGAIDEAAEDERKTKDIMEMFTGFDSMAEAAASRYNQQISPAEKNKDEESEDDQESREFIPITINV
eukprot:TRINITY_DN1357_c0_g1_i2.p1 TRINITY_DN1357_c0_g1~~TRINITY_DN1357_c0_g1_i2.p1  ORF type:complete len:246 (-),score=78.95 TRINITY_DN1357_c0_g1_i2:83-781(-)